MIDSIIIRKCNNITKHKHVAYFSKLAIKLLSYELKVTYDESLESNNTYVFVSNHQGTIDPAIIYAAIDIPFTFVSKQENKKIPIIGSWMKTIRTITFDRNSRKGNISMLRESISRIKEGTSILIFPEGTRSLSNDLGEFKLGALNIASVTKSDIVPVSLTNAFAFDKKLKVKLYIHIGKPIKYSDYKSMDMNDVNELVYNTVNKNIKK